MVLQWNILCYTVLQWNILCYSGIYCATVESYDDTVESYYAIRGHNGIQK